MNSQLLIVESALLFVSVIALLIFKEWEGDQKIIKLLFSFSNMSIFLLEIKQIGESNYVLIAISGLLMILLFYKEMKKVKNEIPQIQIINAQNSEINNKVDQEIEFPQQLPVIHSIHESNSSMNQNQNEPQNDNNKHQQNFSEEKVEQQNSREQPINHLGDNKRPSYQFKNTGPGVLITRQQSVAQIQPNLNVIKFQDDFGEIKFGILKTLKSVAYDQLGREVECIFQNDRPLTKLLSTVEQTKQPRMQILYESQGESNKYVDDKLRGAIKFDDLGYDNQKQEKKITWQKIIKALILIIILNLNFIIFDNWNLLQLILIYFIMQRQILQYKKLIANQLELKCEVRDILIWLSLVSFPMMIVFVINIVDQKIGRQILKVASWVSLIITSKYSKRYQEHFYGCLSYIFILTTLLCFI